MNLLVILFVLFGMLLFLVFVVSNFFEDDKKIFVPINWDLLKKIKDSSMRSQEILCLPYHDYSEVKEKIKHIFTHFLMRLTNKNFDDMYYLTPSLLKYFKDNIDNIFVTPVLVKDVHIINNINGKIQAEITSQVLNASIKNIKKDNWYFFYDTHKNQLTILSMEINTYMQNINDITEYLK